MPVTNRRDNCKDSFDLTERSQRVYDVGSQALSSTALRGRHRNFARKREPIMAIQPKDRRAVGVKVLPEGVEEYCERHTTVLTALHARLIEETEEKTTTANFLVGELEGAFLKMLVRMTQAKNILEVGMFTGYSALCFAEALPADGRIITCELDPRHIEIAGRYFAQSPHRNKIEIRAGRAADTLKTLSGPFDLCFIDADKPSYDYYYDRCVDLVRKGGLIVLDNMLRYGRVLNPVEEDSRIVNALNGRVHKDPRVENVLLPFRDGIMLAYKL